MTIARPIVATVALASVLCRTAVSAGAQDCTGASATGVGFVPLAPPAGYIARIVITAPSTCPWSLLSDTGMLAVLPPSSGTGGGQVNVELAPNPGSVRNGFVTLTLGSQELKFAMVTGPMHLADLYSAAAAVGQGCPDPPCGQHWRPTVREDSRHDVELFLAGRKPGGVDSRRPWRRHHQTQGWVAAWWMNGLTMREGKLLTSGQVTDTGWKLVGPR